MANNKKRIYWDTCVFLSYINAEEGRLPTVEAILADVSSDDGIIIVTSTISKVEVALAASEQENRALDPGVEQAIDQLWNDSSIVELVEFHDEIAIAARTLMRNAIRDGLRKLKTYDAVHLATAIWIGADEFHTYDDLERYSQLTGLRICEPYILQTRLPNM